MAIDRGRINNTVVNNGREPPRWLKGISSSLLFRLEKTTSFESTKLDWPIGLVKNRERMVVDEDGGRFELWFPRARFFARMPSRITYKSLVTNSNDPSLVVARKKDKKGRRDREKCIIVKKKRENAIPRLSSRILIRN